MCVCVNQERSQPVSAGMEAPLGHFHIHVFLSAFQLNWSERGIEREKEIDESVRSKEREREGRKKRSEEGRKEGRRRGG